jgi:ATP-dependent DNA ligase
MALPVPPDVPPMLGRLRRDLPVDGYLYEPKWDGLRCVVSRDGAGVDMRSRAAKRLSRYFPEIVAAFAAMREDRFVIDGELVVVRPDGFDFEALLARIHPAASRVAALSGQTPATFVAFDVLASGDDDLTALPFVRRRAILEKLLSDRPERVELTRTTADAAIAAAWLARYRGGGIDGVVAKRSDLAYHPGARAMVKVKAARTAQCVAAGFRLYERTLLPSSLLLGLHDDDRALRHIGIASGFGAARSRSLLDDVRGHVVGIDEHPWRCGFGPRRSPLGRLRGAASRWDPEEMPLDWVPLRPALVCEVTYEQVDRLRLRHPARFVRWCDDVCAASCTTDQLVAPAPDLAELLA